jgi:hypothetical protein
MVALYNGEVVLDTAECSGTYNWPYKEKVIICGRALDAMARMTLASLMDCPVVPESADFFSCLSVFSSTT